jgi:hypothetical protein
MEHVSSWHYFNENERSTYPRVVALVQVKHASGRIAEGDSHELFSSDHLLVESPVVAWRYIKPAGLR